MKNKKKNIKKDTGKEVINMYININILAKFFFFFFFFFCKKKKNILKQKKKKKTFFYL